jgi:hypothetical protein
MTNENFQHAREPKGRRQDQIWEAYRQAVGDPDYSSYAVRDYPKIEDLLPDILAAVPDVTLEEVCAARLEDEKIGHDPWEIELEDPPYCLLVPTGHPTDPVLIGPFDTYKDAEAFAKAHPERCSEARIQHMARPASTVLYLHEENAGRTNLANKLGVTSEVLKPPRLPRDAIIEITPAAARDVAQYLERDCTLPRVQEICELLKTAATTECIVIPKDPPPELTRSLSE